ncbi:MAG TPA: type II toxin-antitoxin system PemK/MazF family toxin, partial [Advenella sp.]|nr:type II toxin-antitoxin system PemK/MazF family toxin [Advenella sp.]
KPRPALVIQSDLFDALATVTLLPITSTLVNAPIFRITLTPDAGNRLRKPSQIMIDKAITVSQERVSASFGCIDARTMLRVERALALFFGLA